MDDECSSWYNRIHVGFFCHRFGIGEKELCIVMPSVYEVDWTNPTPQCEVIGIECYGGQVEVIFLLSQYVF